MSYKWPGIPNGDYSFDHGRAVWNRIINFLRRLCEKLDGDLVDATSDRRGLMTAEDKAALDAVPDTYVRKAGDTVTGSIYNIFTSENGQPVNHFWGRMAVNDFWALRAGGEVRWDPDRMQSSGPDDCGYLEIATADNGTEPIYVAQYLGTHTGDGEIFASRVRRATLLDVDGMTRFPVGVAAPRFYGPATKLGTDDVGSATNPVYLDEGVPRACTYELNKSVPADAVFTDTVYTHPEYTALTGEPTTNQKPGFGDTVTVSQVKSDGTGHVTAMDDKTITIPEAEASQSAHGLMSVNDKKKLDGITAGAEPNQNAFASVLVGNTNVAADTKSDTLTLVAGSNITLTADATNDKITIAAKDTVTTVSTTGNGNAITSITANNGALTATKGSTFLLANANAVSSSKLNTPRTISAGDLEYEGSASFDGSGNVNLNVTPYKAIVSIGNTNNYPFHYIGTTGLRTSGYLDYVITLLVGRDYINGGGGICRIEVRTNNVAGGALATAKVKWLIRDPDLPVDSIQVGFRDTSGDTIADIFYYSSGAWNSAIVRVLGVGGRTSIARTFTLVDSTEVSNTTSSSAGASVNSFKTIAAAATALHSTKPYTSTIIASDVGIVKTAKDVNNHTHSDYVQKTGDTMSGTLNFSSTIPHITANASGKNAQLFIQSAVSHLDGAWLRLDGRNNAWPGAFQLGASDGTNTYQLDGTPDGNLHWYGLGLESDGKIIASTFQGDLSGNATTATTLKNTRTIDGVNFNGSANITHYGICSTAAATAAKTVSCTGFVLATGARIIVKFANANTNASPTLNVNSTGAKAIKYRNATVTADSIKANSLYEFVYDGSAYQLVGTLEEIIARSFSFNATYITTNNSSITAVPGGTIFNFCLQSTTALSGTYTSYNIGTYTNPVTHGIRFLLTRQDNGLSIPALITSNGNICIEQKSIKGDNTWLWGGVFVPNN